MAGATLPMNDPIWGEHRIDPETPSRIKVGSLELEVAIEDGELWWSSNFRSSPGSEDGAEPTWARWVGRAEVESVILAPCLPDRPVVVEPEIQIHIAPRARSVVYVSLPLWVRLIAGSEYHVVAELPTRRPADTWWGDPTQGELAYAHTTKARRRLWEGGRPIDSVACRLELLNHSEDSLPVTRVAVRAPQLGVYRGAAGLWANEVRVTFTDDADGSQIEILKGPPKEAGQVDLASPPRVLAAGRWRALTFSRLVRGGPW